MSMMQLHQQAAMIQAQQSGALKPPPGFGSKMKGGVQPVRRTFYGTPLPSTVEQAQGGKSDATRRAKEAESGR